MKIGFFITARLKSSRLKQKILLDLRGYSVLDRVIQRCRSVEGIDGVVLCTSTNPQDSVLYNYALRHGIQFFPGSETDVLDRLLKAAEYFGYDAFLSITADNPLFSVYLGQIAVDWFKKEMMDFIFIKGVPIGCNPYFLSTSAVKIANHLKKTSDTEIWGPFVNRDDFFSIGNIHVKNSPFKEEKRLTVDYPEDYELIRKIYDALPSSPLPRIHEVFEVLKRNPNLWSINAMHQQCRVPEAVLQEINRHFDNQRQSGLELAKRISVRLCPGLKIIEVEI